MDAADINPSPIPKNGESQAHRDLKRLALLWAQTHGFRVAAAEVSLPNHRVRMDVAAYQPQRVREVRRDERTRRERLAWKTTIGATAIFECKASATDFIRDARSMKATVERLQVLHEKRERAEQELKIHYPSIRNGDSLFQEYETLNFERPGYERYEKILRKIRQLSDRLHGNTKFDRLTKYGAANLFYVVAEPAAVCPHVLPCGWGLLERVGDELVLQVKPHWHEVSEEDRLAFFQRIALAATRAVNREHGAAFVPEGRVLREVARAVTDRR
ncbi:MAG: hypothetical protein ABJF10_06515 [Chthoniobacter sp.]|uniref:hypothetical protein n=1 Tax=Chthoniobacter sp. TaxID=2510640 RepID=UPI0032AE16EE